jgi:hypothetical protein
VSSRLSALALERIDQWSETNYIEEVGEDATQGAGRRHNTSKLPKESLLFTNDTPVNFPSKIISRSLFPFAANPDITFPFPVLRIVSTAQTQEAKQIK